MDIKVSYALVMGTVVCGGDTERTVARRRDAKWRDLCEEEPDVRACRACESCMVGEVGLVVGLGGVV